jgi:hypothetical protein
MSTIFVLVDGILRVQQTLSGSDVNVNIDPILCGAIIECTDAIGHEPFVDKIESLFGWGDEIVNFLDCEMLAIPRMVRVGDFRAGQP